MAKTPTGKHINDCLKNNLSDGGANCRQLTKEGLNLLRI